MEFKELVYATLGNPPSGVPSAENESKRMDALFESLTASFEKRGAEMTPLLGLRTADVVSAWLTVTKLEEKLRQEGIVSSDETSPATRDGGSRQPEDPSKSKGSSPHLKDKPSASRKRPVPNPLVESAAKAWDRLRKAMNDLEEMLPEEPPMQAMTLPDLVAPLFEKAEGVLEDALAFEERKKRRKARLNGVKKPEEPMAAIAES